MDHALDSLRERAVQSIDWRRLAAHVTAAMKAKGWGVPSEDDELREDVEAAIQNGLNAIGVEARTEQPASAVQGENLTWALEQGGILADWCNVAGDALRSLLDAYERRVRSSCATEADLGSEPWRCAEYMQAEQALKTKPSPSVEITTPPPAPAAEQGLNLPDTLEQFVAGQRTAPSLPLGEMLDGQPEARGVEEIAKALWHRFGDDSRVEWEDEPEKAIYRDTAAQVFAIAATPSPARAEQPSNNYEQITSKLSGDNGLISGQAEARGVEGMVSVPVRLSALHVSEIKDMIEADYDIYDAKARPLWASMLQIVAGLSIEQQEGINEQRAALASASETPRR